MTRPSSQQQPLDICLIACSASKAATACAARDLYTGDFFRKALQWAEASKRFRSILVLSAKHGLIDLDQVIAPYDESLTQLPAARRRTWASRVGKQLVQLVSSSIDAGTPLEVVMLAGRHYTDDLLPQLQELAPQVKCSRPLSGLGIGAQKAWLKRQIEANHQSPHADSPPAAAVRRTTSGNSLRLVAFGLPPTFPREFVPVQVDCFIASIAPGTTQSELLRLATEQGFQPLWKPLPHIGEDVYGFCLDVSGLQVPLMVRMAPIA